MKELPSQDQLNNLNQLLEMLHSSDCATFLYLCSSTWLSLAAPIVVLIVGFSGAYWASSTIKSNKESAKTALEDNRLIAKQRATMDYLMQRSRDERFVDSYRLLAALHKCQTIDIKCFAENDPKLDFSEITPLFDDPLNVRVCKNALSYVLNQYEYMSVGVENKIYDEKILLNCTRTSAVQFYDITQVYIKAEREKLVQKTGNPSTLFIRYEALVSNWRDKQANL